MPELVNGEGTALPAQRGGEKGASSLLLGWHFHLSISRSAVKAFPSENVN